MKSNFLFPLIAVLFLLAGTAWADTPKDHAAGTDTEINPFSDAGVSSFPILGIADIPSAPPLKPAVAPFTENPCSTVCLHLPIRGEPPLYFCRIARLTEKQGKLGVGSEQWVFRLRPPRQS